MAMIYSLGHVSGAHFNPAVTIAFSVNSQFPWKEVQTAGFPGLGRFVPILTTVIVLGSSVCLWSIDWCNSRKFKPQRPV